MAIVPGSRWIVVTSVVAVVLTGYYLVERADDGGSVSAREAERTVKELVKVSRAGDRKAARRLAAPDVAREILGWTGSSYATVKVGDCYASFDDYLEKRPDPDEKVDGGVAGCVVTVFAPEPASDFYAVEETDDGFRVRELARLTTT